MPGVMYFTAPITLLPVSDICFFLTFCQQGCQNIGGKLAGETNAEQQLVLSIARVSVPNP